MSQVFTRRQLLKAAAAGPFLQTSRSPNRKPNFLFLLTNDLAKAVFFQHKSDFGQVFAPP
jgi:hypothetical protein